MLVANACSTGKTTKSSASPTPSASASASPSPSPSASTAASTVNPLSCTTQVVDLGQKGSVTAVSRGTYSDVKLIPGSSSPAVAYADAGALSLKVNYWSGSQFVTEVVAGDGAGAFVRIAFLPSGVPVVTWTQGANLKVAIRSAALGTTGTWAAGVVDTGTAPRAVEIAISPLGQVLLSYLSDTATGGRARMAYCDAPCSSPLDFQTMTPSNYIENTAIVAAQVSTGAGWCKASSTSYYPAVTYAVTGTVKYAVCQNTLANCKNVANWLTQSVVASGNLSNKLLLDPTVTGDVPKVLTLAAGGLTPYKMGSTACTAAPAAFSAGTAMGGATTGTLWASFAKDSAGKFHAWANTSTTSVSYFNSTTTDPVGAWNATGTVDNAAMAAANAGGAVLDTTLSTAYVSYGINVAPFNLKLAQINSITVASNSATYNRLSPDLTGAIQLAAANSQQNNVAVARTSAGRTAIAYVDFSIGAAASAKLKYAIRTGTGASATWSIQQIPSTQNPQFPGVAFDESDRPWISFFDAANNRFYLTVNSSTDGSGAWAIYEFPATPAGAPVALPAANQTAVAMHTSSGVSNPVMLVIDTNASSKGVKAARFDKSTLSWSAVATIETLVAGAAGASHLSVDYNSAGDIIAGFYDINATRAKYVVATSGTTWSTPIAVSSVNQGMGATVRINPATSKPGMLYFDRANNNLYYASCTGTLATCASAGWSASVIDPGTGTSGLAVGNDQLLNSALLYLSGNPYAYYPRGSGSSGALIVNQAASGSFQDTVLAAGSNGNVSGVAALNFAIAGWNVAAGLNAAGAPFGAYVGPGNWLYAFSCGE